jgi:hypothetical protein
MKIKQNNLDNLDNLEPQNLKKSGMFNGPKPFSCGVA